MFERLFDRCFQLRQAREARSPESKSLQRFKRAKTSRSDSAKQGRQEARKAPLCNASNVAGHQVCLAREAKLPGKEAPKTTRKTCHRRRVTSLTTDDNG